MAGTQRNGPLLVVGRDPALNWATQMLAKKFELYVIGFLLRCLCKYRFYALAEAVADRYKPKLSDSLLFCLVYALARFKQGGFVDCHKMCLKVHVGLHYHKNNMESGSTANFDYLVGYVRILGACAEARVLSEEQRIFDERRGAETWEEFFARIAGEMPAEEVSYMVKFTLPLRSSLVLET